MQGSGPVLMENYLRKYDGPRPSTATSRRSLASRGGRPSTAANRLTRPGTADSIRSVGSRGSYASNFSNASTMSFLDRFATADGKEKRLLMMQKKMELNEAMQKRVQIDQRRSCTPDLLRKLSGQVDRMVSAEDLAREDLEGDESALRNSDLMNRLSGRISLAEVIDNPLLDRQMREMTSAGMLQRPMSSSAGLRNSASLPSLGRQQLAGRTLPRERPMSRTHGGSRPWAQGSRQGSRSRVSGDSLVTTLKSRLNENGITRGIVEEVLGQQVSVHSSDGGNCHIADLENALRCLGFTFSSMEKIYVKKTFPGGGPNVHYQGFLERFWPTGRTLARGNAGGAPVIMLSTTELSKVEFVLRNQLKKMEDDGDATMPPAMTLLVAFQAADDSNKGAVRTSALHEVFRQFGFDVSGELAQMIGSRYCYGKNPKLVDYHRFISTIVPPELTMEERNLDKSARFFGGESEKGPAVVGGLDVTGSFFDISEKLKDEAKGNRQNLMRCFEMLDSDNTAQLSLHNFRKALSLLRVDLSERSIQKQFGAFISSGRVDVRRVMDELFPADEDFRDDLNLNSAVDTAEKAFRKEVQRKWGSLLNAFVAIDRNRTKAIDRQALAYCFKHDLGMDVTPQTVDSLFRRWDTNGGGSLCFSEFMELFGVKSTEANLVTTKDVKEVQNQIRDSIEAHLDGGGGGGLLKAYKFFDRDRSGNLTYDEMAEGIAKYANVNISPSMLAQLMEKYDPEYTGSIDFNKFVHNVMLSSEKDSSSFNNQASGKAGSRASSSWSIEQLEQAIKKKMERSWTQIQDACRSADIDNSNTISREELRGLLEHFCFVLNDKQFDALAERLNMTDGAEVSYDAFMKYFARLGGSYYHTLSADMSVDEARKVIQEKISSKLTGGPGGLLRAFKMFDRDRSGSLSYMEFANVLREVAMIDVDPALSDRLMASYDVDGDGTLDYHEFVQQVMGSAVDDKSSFDNEDKKEEVSSSTAINRRWQSAEVDNCLRKKLGERPAHVKRQFNSCDNQRKGTCTVEELRTILRKNNLDMTSTQFGDVLSHFDIVDGMISHEDFCAAYVDTKQDTVPRDVSIINDMSVGEAKQLIQEAIRSRLGTGQAELLRAFKFFDRDRSGTIAADEFQEAMKVYAMLDFSDELAAKLMKEFDEDGNGEIDYQEFTTLVMGSKKDDLTSLNTAASTEYVSTAAGNDMMMLRQKIRSQWKDLLQAFRAADKDKSGTLDDAELRRVLHRFNVDLGDSQFAELMQEIDEDRDGQVSYAEFMKFFGKGQAEDRILHTVVHNVTLKQAQTMLTDKMAERYGAGPQASSQMKKTLGHFDSGKTGSITVDAFKSAMIEFASLEFEPEIMAEMLRPFNDNGKIDYIQFVQKGLGDSGSTGIDVGRRKYSRNNSHDEKPQSPPMDAPANPAPADTAGVKKMLQLIAEKVEAKSRNIAVTFRNFDEDKSGAVDYDEFRKGLMHLGVEMTDSDFAKLLAVVDNDKSGCINYQEFVEDLKHVDEQTGGFLGDPHAQKKTAAAKVSIVEPTPIVHAAPGRSSGSILQQIADKVEQKSKNIRIVFRNFDEDKSGSVDYQEFRKGLEHIGIHLTDVDFQTLLGVVDNDNSGTIDYNEFVEDLKHTDEQTGGFFGGGGGAPKAPVAARPTPIVAPPAARAAASSGRSSSSILHQIADKVEQKAKNVRVVFRNFDEDKSGHVDYVEFRRGLAHLGIALSDADFETLIDVVDNDKSGTIDYNEFVEDLKHVDQQVGDFVSHDSQQQMMKARQRPQSRHEIAGPVVSGGGANALAIQGSGM